MKYAADRPYADPDKAARRILEIANAVEPIQGRIHIEKINGPFLFRDRGSPAEYGAGLKLAIERGWLDMHGSRDFRQIHRVRRGVVRVTTCSRCEDSGWVCEDHPERPWDGRMRAAAVAPARPAPIATLPVMILGHRKASSRSRTRRAGAIERQRLGRRSTEAHSSACAPRPIPEFAESRPSTVGYCPYLSPVTKLNFEVS